MAEFLAESGEHTVQDAVSKLRFIAQLRVGERVDVTTLSIIPDTYYNRSYRALFARGESRVATYDFVHQALDGAHALAVAYLSSERDFDRKLGHMLAEALTAARPGIETMSLTYGDDRMFVSRVSTLLDTLDAKLAELPLGWRPARSAEAGADSA